MEVKFMKIENNYPDIKEKVNKFLIFRKIMLIIFPDLQEQLEISFVDSQI